MENIVKPRNIDGKITCPPGYELQPTGECVLVSTPEADVPEWQKDTEAGQRAYRERFYDPASPHYIGEPAKLLPMSTEDAGKGSVGGDAGASTEGTEKKPAKKRDGKKKPQSEGDSAASDEGDGAGAEGAEGKGADAADSE